MPLVVRVKDQAGTSLADVTGWLDPNEPPNVLYGAAAHEVARGPMQELVVERLVGPFTVAGATPLTIDVSLGADRVGQARIVERRLVVHDDALPSSVRNAFLGVGAGGVAFLVGLSLLVVGWRRKRAAGQKRRGGNRGVSIV
jgi:hypothetical protein